MLKLQATSKFRKDYKRIKKLLIYAIHKDELILVASRTGSHADLFNM